MTATLTYNRRGAHAFAQAIRREIAEAQHRLDRCREVGDPEAVRLAARTLRDQLDRLAEWEVEG